MADGIDWFKNYEKDKERNRKMPAPSMEEEERQSVSPMQDIAKQRLLHLHDQEEAEMPVSLPTAR